MSNPQFKIHIENPCSVDKQNFTPTETGFFCSQCQKCVVDYTQYSDKKLAHEFGQKGNTGCGIFTSQQLEKVYKINASASSKSRRWPLWLFSGLFATRLVAQEQPTVDSTLTAQYPKADSLMTDSLSIDSTITETAVVEDDPVPKVDLTIDKTNLAERLRTVGLTGNIATIGIVSREVKYGDFITPKCKTPSIFEQLKAPISQSRDTLSKAIKALNPNKEPKPKSNDSSPAKGLFATWLQSLVPRRFDTEHEEDSKS